MATLASDTSFLRFHKDNTNLPFFQISGAFLYQSFVRKRLEIIDFFCIIFAVEIRFDNLSSSSSKILEYRPDILSTATSLTLGID